MAGESGSRPTTWLILADSYLLFTLLKSQMSHYSFLPQKNKKKNLKFYTTTQNNVLIYHLLMF